MRRRDRLRRGRRSEQRARSAPERNLFLSSDLGLARTTERGTMGGALNG